MFKEASTQSQVGFCRQQPETRPRLRRSQDSPQASGSSWKFDNFSDETLILTSAGTPPIEPEIS